MQHATSPPSVVLLSAVAMLVPVTAAQAAPLFTASQVLAPTSNGVNLGLSMQMYGGRIPDLATAQQIARSHTSVSAAYVFDERTGQRVR